MRERDIEALEALGFFRYASAAERSEAVRLIRKHNFAFAGSDHRMYHADAECLAEQGVRDFLGSVAPFLRRAGVPITVTYRTVKTHASGGLPARWAAATLDADGWLDENGASSYVETLQLSLRAGAPMVEVTEDDQEPSETYTLHLGDRELIIYNIEPGAPWDSWGKATRATLALLNELLAAHTSDERAYALSSGNGLYVAFVTPEMARIINAAADPQSLLHDGSDSSRWTKLRARVRRLISDLVSRS